MKKKTAEDEFYISGYTLHPPKGEYEPEELKQLPGHVSEFEINPQTAMLLEIKRGHFKRTKNPILAIEAFLIAHEARIYPPLWVLDFMEGAFKKWHGSKDKESLDKGFGLTGGKGSTRPYKLLLHEERDAMLCFDVFRLSLLGYSVQEASHIVASRLKETPSSEFDKDRLGIEKLSARTIEDIYGEKQGKGEYDAYTRQRTLKWLKDNKEAFLSNFPKHSFPA